MHTKALLLILLLVSFVTQTIRAEETPPTGTPSVVEKMNDAIFLNDEKAIEKALKDVVEAAKAKSDDVALQLAAARGHLAIADLLRIDRQTDQTPASQVEAVRARQAKLGEAGNAFAEKAKKLATTKEEKSEAYRLAGECNVHRISGPIAGMRYGPSAKSDIEYAISLDPENWEARRAQGLMFLNNPPINGGDLNAALVTFTECTKKGGDRDHFHALLAQTWMKRERPERARLEVLKTLEINPNNRLAKNIQKQLEKSGKW